MKRLLTAGLLSALLLLATGTPARAGGPPPAQRIVTLAPHLAELVYAAGAGPRLVGVSAFSDYPPAVRTLPRVGDAFRVDYEALAALRPDLVLAWTSGNPPPLLARLRELGYRVVALEPAGLDDVATQLAEVGELAGTGAEAAAAAARYRADLAALRAEYAGRAPVTVFYQVAVRPLLTVSRRHVIGQVLELCGGRNPFADLPGLTPVVSMEAVLEAAPEAIIAGAASDADLTVLAAWSRWQTLPAVRRDQLFSVNADLLSRPGPRLPAGARRICADLDQARNRPQR